MMMQPNCIKWVDHLSIKPKTSLFDILHMYTQTERQTTICNSIGCDLAKPNHPIIQNQSFQVYHTLLKWKSSKGSPFKSTIPSQSESWQNQSFQDHHTLSGIKCPKWNLSIISSFKTPYPPRVKIIENQSFEDCHTLPKWKLYKTIFQVSLSYQLGELCLPGDLNEYAEVSLYALYKTIFQVTLSYQLNKLCLLGDLNKYAESLLCHQQMAYSGPCSKYNSTDSMWSLSQETLMNLQRLPCIPFTRPSSE